MITIGSCYSACVQFASAVKNYYLCRFLQAADIERATGGENPYAAGLADDTAAKGKIPFTARSYAKPAAKAFITTGYLARGDHRS
jgi:hypothetical protein